MTKRYLTAFRDISDSVLDRGSRRSMPFSTLTAMPWGRLSQPPWVEFFYIVIEYNKNEVKSSATHVEGA
jgi:hypothetical protein